MAFLPEGNALVSASEIDRTLRHWDLSDTTQSPPNPRTLVQGKAIVCLAFDRNLRALVCGEADGILSSYKPDDGFSRQLDLDAGSAVKTIEFAPMVGSWPLGTRITQ